MENNISLNRWRLVLGKHADDQITFQEEEPAYREMDEMLDFLYERERGEERGGSLEPSQLTVPTWISKVRELFPKETIEIMENHALEKYELTALLQDKQTLEKMEPNINLLKCILQFKDYVKPDVLDTAKRIVAKVTEELHRNLEQEVKHALSGRPDRNRSSRVCTMRNFDFKKTIRKNLKHFDKETNTIHIEKTYFYAATKHVSTWRVILAVDESGSMIDSVIHSAVMAGIFASLPTIKTNLFIFDTAVVDLTDRIDDPVETLMSVQLGGGTYIAQALRYATNQIEIPHKTIVVLVTDLYEGGSYNEMYREAMKIVESGAKLIVLTSLDPTAQPFYDKEAAKKIAALGAHVAALTPGRLAQWIATIIS
ncbi:MULTISPECIES: VWA domain-containing protein [Bacillus]|uniref:VWA domain-containing protein n=1 Tax=Bacillus TaxID=1386 RepID=UPI00321FA387|nr:VWA domain-containing protein [Bacillus cereus]